MDESANQGRGPNPPKAGIFDFVLAFLIGYCIYNALMFLWESKAMNVSNDDRYCVPTKGLTATGWFVVVYFGALFSGLLLLTWAFS